MAHDQRSFYWDIQITKKDQFSAVNYLENLYTVKRKPDPLPKKKKQEKKNKKE